VWDLHFITPTATRSEYPISAVPDDTPRIPQGVLALPGTYTVRMTVNGKTLTAPLTIKMDPRVKASEADLEGLFKLETALSDALSKSAKADLEAHSIREQIEKLSKSAPAEVKDALEKEDKEIASLLSGKEKSPNSEAEPGLDDVSGEAAELYGQVGQVDAAPTVAQEKAGEHIGGEVREIVEKWERLKSASLPELNRKLGEAHLPAIDLERRPETMPEGGDED